MLNNTWLKKKKTSVYQAYCLSHTPFIKLQFILIKNNKKQYT